MGRTDFAVPWEDTSKANDLRKQSTLGCNCCC